MAVGIASASSAQSRHTRWGGFGGRGSENIIVGLSNDTPPLYGTPQRREIGRKYDRPPPESTAAKWPEEPDGMAGLPMRTHTRGIDDEPRRE
jgi:hypothetical protein